MAGSGVDGGDACADLSDALSEPPGSLGIMGGSGYARTMRRILALSSLVAIFVTISRAAVADQPSPEATRACFDAARAWLRGAGAAPLKQAENAGQKPSVPSLPEVDCSAAAVVIRLDGRPIGHATRAGPGTALAGSCLAEAWAMAMADRRIEALPTALRDRLGERVTLELELAGRPEPLVGERLDALAARVDPALEAFAIRNGDRWAFAMPCVLQARNQAPRLNYLALGVAREAGLDPAASRDLRLPDGAAAYRATTRRLAQPSFDADPFESWRGAPLADPSSSDADRVRAMASRLADHLEQRWPNSEGLPAEAAASVEALGPRASYQPSSATWPSPVSPPADQALAALAMARWSRMPGLDPEAQRRARAFARRTLASLRQVEAQESDPRGDVAALSCVMLAARDLDAGDPAWADSSTRDWLGQLAQALRTSSEGDALPQGAAAAMACAALGEAAPDALRRRAWDPEQPERALQSTPWLADRLPPDAAPAWKDALEQLLAAQCTSWSAPSGPRDADGGWGGSAAMPRPTAASAKVTLALATALGRPELLDAQQRSEAIRSLRRSLRFLRQLQVDEAGCHAFRDPARALGGVRAAPWDSDQPMAASAYALLACVAADPSLRDQGSPSRAP